MNEPESPKRMNRIYFSIDKQIDISSPPEIEKIKLMMSKIKEKSEVSEETSNSNRNRNKQVDSDKKRHRQYIHRDSTEKAIVNTITILVSHLKKQYYLPNFHFFELYIYFNNFTNNSTLNRESFIISNLNLFTTNQKIVEKKVDNSLDKRVLKDLYRALEGQDGLIHLDNLIIYLKHLAYVNSTDIDGETLYKILDKDGKGSVTEQDLSLFFTGIEEFIYMSDRIIDNDDTSISSMGWLYEKNEGYIKKVFRNSKNKTELKKSEFMKVANLILKEVEVLFLQLEEIINKKLDEVKNSHSKGKKFDIPNMETINLIKIDYYTESSQRAESLVNQSKDNSSENNKNRTGSPFNKLEPKIGIIKKEVHNDVGKIKRKIEKKSTNANEFSLNQCDVASNSNEEIKLTYTDTKISTKNTLTNFNVLDDIEKQKQREQNIKILSKCSIKPKNLKDINKTEITSSNLEINILNTNTTSIKQNSSRVLDIGIGGDQIIDLLIDKNKEDMVRNIRIRSCKKININTFYLYRFIRYNCRRIYFRIQHF
jgi:hypothetical protein